MSDMSLISIQVVGFLWSVAIGAGLGLLYDCFRILRLAIKCPASIIVVQDVVFGILCAIVSFGYLLTVTDGKLRVFLLIGEGIGWAFYYATVGDVVMALSEAIINTIKCILRFFAGILIFIWKIIRFILIDPVMKICLSLKRYILEKLLGVKKKAFSKAVVLRNKIQSRIKKPSKPKKNPDSASKKNILSKFFLQTKA